MLNPADSTLTCSDKSWHYNRKPACIMLHPQQRHGIFTMLPPISTRRDEKESLRRYNWECMRAAFKEVFIDQHSRILYMRYWWDEILSWSKIYVIKAPFGFWASRTKAAPTTFFISKKENSFCCGHSWSQRGRTAWLSGLFTSLFIFSFSGMAGLDAINFQFSLEDLVI